MGTEWEFWYRETMGMGAIMGMGGNGNSRSHSRTPLDHTPIPSEFWGVPLGLYSRC